MSLLSPVFSVATAVFLCACLSVCRDVCVRLLDRRGIKHYLQLSRDRLATAKDLKQAKTAVYRKTLTRCGSDAVMQPQHLIVVPACR